MAKQNVHESAPITPMVPEQNSPEWDSYVMSLFLESELIDGNPRVHGLRRVAELLIGEIISSKPITVMITPQNDKMDKSTVVYEVQFRTSNGDKVYADVADTWEGNTDDMFAVHGTATASTKAEARALRKALKIKAVAAEELCKKDVSKYLSEQKQTEENKRITKDQINFITMKCKKLDIDVIKFINSGEKFYNSIHEIKYETAKLMINKLAKFSSNKELIEDCIKGYQEGWNE